MQSVVGNKKQRSIFQRRTLVLGDSQSRETPPAPTAKLPRSLEPCTALIINASHEMAKEMTLQLTLHMPACSIMYAPTIEIAKWILTRRKIDLIVASPVLDDGPIERLHPVLEKMKCPADLVVVGALARQNVSLAPASTYHCSTLRRINTPTPEPHIVRKRLERANVDLTKSIKTLGADIRNDLNNPLQEIVAMVFVAKTGAQASKASECALEAIERAAKNMSKLVNSLEDKIRGAVGAA